METFEEDKWYVAYAIRHWASPDDILLNKAFDTVKEALEYAKEFLCDDDDCNIFYRKNNHWYKLMLCI